MFLGSLGMGKIIKDVLNMISYCRASMDSDL